MGALNALLPVVTLVLGYFGTLVTEGRRDRRAARTAEHEREMAAQEQREADRQAAVRRRESFELETLDRVLVELADLGRAVGQIDAEDLQSARSAQGSNRLTERVSNDWFFANRALRRSIPMVLDPEIRAVARQMADAAARAAVGAVKPNEGNEQRTLAMLAAQEDTEERVGQRIRELYLAGVVLPDVPTRLYEHQITPRGSTGLP